MYKNTFVKDLKEANIIEDEMIKLLSKEGDIIIKTPNNIIFKDYDFIINNIKYECKFDKMSDKTGNICIEFEYNNNSSGINSTKADYYIIKTYKSVYLIKVKKLKKLINNIENIKIMYGGYKKKSKMYLININYFEKYKI